MEESTRWRSWSEIIREVTEQGAVTPKKKKKKKKKRKEVYTSKCYS